MRTAPPSMRKTWPVTNPRTPAKPASGRPRPHLPASPSGPAASPGEPVLASARDAWSPQAVRIHPGARQLTRTCGARLSARLRQNAITAPLAVANSSPLSPAIPVSAWSQPMLRRTPRPRSFIRRPTSRDSRIVAATSTASNSANLRSKDHWAAGPVSVSAPALLIQMSMLPQVSQALIRQSAALLRVAQVGVQNVRSNPGRLRLGRNLRRLGTGAPAVNDNVGPGARQLQGDGPTDAARRSGDNGFGAGQVTVSRRIFCRQLGEQVADGCFHDGMEGERCNFRERLQDEIAARASGDAARSSRPPLSSSRRTRANRGR